MKPHYFIIYLTIIVYYESDEDALHFIKLQYFPLVFIAIHNDEIKNER